MLTVSPDVVWFVEYQGVSVVDYGSGARLSIPYPHAALWCLIGRKGFHKTRALTLMGEMSECDRIAAGKEVDKTLGLWLELGIICED